jgi:hypothetical protein
MRDVGYGSAKPHRVTRLSSPLAIVLLSGEGMNILAGILQHRLAKGTIAGTRAVQILWRRQGFLRSAFAQRCIDANNRPVPWFTYPAIEYLEQLDLDDRTVFEYGSGQSTLFWAARARRVVSVEHNPDWHAFVSARLRQQSESSQIILEPDYDRYIRAITRREEQYDIICIDGIVDRRGRAKCAALALSHLKAGGMMIVDNADYLPGTTRILRDADLIEVDMHGLGPCNPYAWTTSLFFRRDFNIATRGPRQPSHPVGGLARNWEPGLERRMLRGRPFPSGWTNEAPDRIVSEIESPVPEAS